jgi:tetratricopeptide (TPR) repeat protein
MDPRIPQIHSYADLEDHFYIDMEYVEGRDLSEIIREGALPREEAVRIAIELCNILAKTHTCSLEVENKEVRAIVHGDIKPRNIRIDRENRVRVLDFGISKGLSLTRKLTRNYFGSAAYSSPERLDNGEIDEMSDLWAVGVVLYEMIDGRLPFDAPSTEKLEAMVRSRTSPRALTSECTEALEQIIFKALARCPDRRYQNAVDFESDLRAFLAGETTTASRENEETRRTEPGEIAEETRRTEPGNGREQGLSFPAATLAPAPQKASAPVKRAAWVRPLRIGVTIALPLVIAALTLWEATVYMAALDLVPAFASQQMNSDKAWEQYQDIKTRSLLGVAPLVLRDRLKTMLAVSCERITDDYRNNDSPRVREGDWTRCKRDMSRLHQLDASDRRASAVFEYAEGHLLRIGKRDSEAIAAFQRAAAIEPGWPDPHLAMARSYIYGLKEADRGMEALRRAEQLGHKPGRRERAQQADAYRTRGFQFWNGAKQLVDTPQEKDLLKKAKDDLEEALKIYSDLAPWGDSPSQIKAAQESLDRIKERLKFLDPPSIWPWKWLDR